MDADETIIQLGAKLDQWSDELFAKLDMMDRATQAKELLAGIQILREFDRLKAQGLAAIEALLDGQDATTDDERVASLTRGFEFAAKLQATLKDEFSDTDGIIKVDRLMDAIVRALAATHSGRAVLAPLLDHADMSVRAFAGQYLIDLMPDRVIPILREIDDRNEGLCADFKAHWVLLTWERERRGRFNALDVGTSRAAPAS
jgi:hypothetical protein